MALYELIDRFVSRYTNPKTSIQYRAELRALFRHVDVTHPRLLSDAAVRNLERVCSVDIPVMCADSE